MMLRSLKNEDAPFMLEWMHDESVVHNLHKNFASFTIEDCYRFIDFSTKEQGKDIHFAIVRDDGSDEYLGTISLKNIDRETKSAEFGITIRKSAMGTGCSQEAMEELLSKVIKENGITRVYWCVDTKNVRALKFYDKNGYSRICITDVEDIYSLVLSSGQYNRDEIDSYVWYLYDIDSGNL
ncbi:GNAT family N-acetyltransferase [Butyrivibrio sp. INlla14]|uniref:GNAT family N-acetyltransferase n=1 Tax=Butyrivibrio sp. INlla14 TaxID=1520808 RepID=UPI000876B959|nr:GNAT family N-acetyltransferase [Butyrivibrio sp. INlla14]SCY72649.1 diamine N-acetyltransferase [Butyrivibrio sp. INlla14]